MKVSNKSVLSNFFWRFAERCGAQLVTFVVSIVLARILEPEVYGLTALVTVFTSILGVFIDSGFGNALIQKKEADEVDFSTVFYFNIVICSAAYLLMFFSAPLIASLYPKYDENTLIPIIRVMSITLIISGVKNVQQAYISRTMQFKRFFFATLGGTIGAAVIGVFMAVAGFGVWALVAQSLFNSLTDTIILWITVKWRPKFVFSFKRLKVLFSFGWKLMVSSFLEVVYNNLRSLIIGVVYSSSDLAFYNKGKNLPDIVITNINTSIDSVLLPTMSAAQDSVESVRTMTRRAMCISTYVIAPFLIGLAFLAEPIIRMLLTEKWIESAFYMRIFCITFLFYPLHTANLNAMKALGRSDLLLKLEVAKKIVGLIAVFSTMWISAKAMALSLLFTSVLGQFINSWPNKKLLNYGYLEQLKDILPGILMAVFMGVCIYPIGWIGLPDIAMLLIQVPLGAVIYIAGSKIFKLESFQYLWGMIKPVVLKAIKRGK